MQFFPPVVIFLGNREEKKMYLTKFSFPDADREFDFFLSVKRTCYESYYPFQVLSKAGLRRIDPAPVTILYGGNGCGKTTVLNVIAQKLELKRDASFNQSSFFADYVRLCDYEGEKRMPKESRIITSDDVFDFMLDLRAVNEGVDRRREELFDEYLNAKYGEFKYRTMDDLERLRQVNLARSKTQSKFVKSSLIGNVREHSNGESAFTYFTEKIGENALYLLDEPENSLSAQRQQELVTFLEDSARFFGCQFIISTHSPFLLAIKGAKIYDMDERPVDVKRWTQLESVRVYYDFFKKHEREFER